MPENTGTQLDNRNPDGTFKDGMSGNPAGRPVGARNFTTKVREALEKIAEGKDYTYEEALVKSILKKAIVDGDVVSQRLIWNYLDGMPAQKIETDQPISQVIIEIINKHDEVENASDDDLSEKLPEPKQNSSKSGGVGVEQDV